ncbi:Extracellular fatty acid-binding protein, partial [Corvus brachyrhynchos]
FADRGNKTVQLVDTNNRSYMIVLATRQKNGETLHMLRLYS